MTDSVERVSTRPRAKRTVRERLIEALQRRGYEHAAYPSKKYAAFRYYTKHGIRYFFVGAAGALRYGDTISTSHSAEASKRILLREAPE